MRHAYWSTMEEAIYNLFYWQEYRKRIARIDLGVKIFLAVLSCGSIAAWSIWKELPLLWAILIGISQVINTVYPCLPFVKRLYALDFLIPDTKDLVHRITDEWWKLKLVSDDLEAKFEKPFLDFKDQLDDLEIKYLGADVIPDNKRIAKIAWSQYENYIKRFHSQEGGEENAE